MYASTTTVHLASLWHWPLTSDLLINSAHSHGEYLCQFASKSAPLTRSSKLALYKSCNNNNNNNNPPPPKKKVGRDAVPCETVVNWRTTDRRPQVDGYTLAEKVHHTDIWPVTLKTILASSTHARNIRGNLRWHSCTKYKGIASREIGVNGRTDGRETWCSPSTTVNNDWQDWQDWLYIRRG